MSDQIMNFFVFTRFGLGITDDSWYQRKMPLFETVALASLKNQIDTDFDWFVAIDARAPLWVSDWLKGLSQDALRLHVVSIDCLKVERCTLGGYQWVVDEIFKTVGIGNFVRSPDEFLISAQIDDDDAWHRSTVAQVRAIAEESLPAIIEEEDRRPFLLYPSGGLLMNFTNGCNFFLNTLRVDPIEKKFHSMSIFLLTRFLSGVSCASSRHLGWPHFAEILKFKTIHINTEEPMWLYTRHADAIDGNLDSADDLEPLDATVAATFGIDFQTLQAVSEGQQTTWRMDLSDAANNTLRQIYRDAAQNYLDRYSVPND